MPLKKTYSAERNRSDLGRSSNMIYCIALGRRDPSESQFYEQSFKFLSKEKIQENYNKEKELVLETLSGKKENENDGETIKTIDQVIEKIQTESFSEINYLKLKNLRKGL